MSNNKKNIPVKIPTIEDPKFLNMMIKKRLDDEIRKWHTSKEHFGFFQNKFYMLLKEQLNGEDYQYNIKLVDFMNNHKIFYEITNINDLLVIEDLLLSKTFVSTVEKFFNVYF